jgi:hypothetical protein
MLSLLATNAKCEGDRGDRASQAGLAGPAALRLRKLVAQSPSDAEGTLQEGGRDGTRGDGKRNPGDYLIQAVPEPDAGHWVSNRRASDRNGGCDAGK